jgi:hypothetical protein
MTISRSASVGALAFALVVGAPSVRAQAPKAAASTPYDTKVRPVMAEICTTCHNERDHTAGLNLAPLMDRASLVDRRDDWERVLYKLRSGEMPPDDGPAPQPGQIEALIDYVQGELDRIDRVERANPGRVVIHRLNRAEYANTIRDLLGVDFKATAEFPADDSGYGFDNIGDVLTVSPTLMQKYLVVAERLAARAVGGSPLPAPVLLTRDADVRRVTDNVIELRQILEYDAEYDVRVAVAGHRKDNDPPVTLRISMDGVPLKTSEMPVKIGDVARIGKTTHRQWETVRVFVPANEHRFRAEFVGDDGLKAIPEKSRRDTGVNIFPETLEITGPFKAARSEAAPKPVLTCDPVQGGTPCVQKILTSLARRAYRRPLRAGEAAELVRVYTRARAADYPRLASLQFAIARMLVSPQFLFRIEREPRPGTIARISDVELASRLSYFLWSSMPDERLLTLGETHQLRRPEVLQAEVRRMIADPKFSAFAANFGGQWLETRGLDAVMRDATKFPEWGPDLRDAMGTETELFFEALVRDNRPISDFIDANYTFLNERLAKHYGIGGVDGPDFRRVELATDERSGVFTQASVLTVSSYPTRTSVVLRGKYLLENVLNAPPPPPPADVPALDDTAVGVARSLRTQMEAHRSVPLCASCHTKMDPLGFALENYDAIGRWRTEDGKFPIDASGQFPNGRGFTNAAGMKKLLLDNMPQFAQTLTEKMLIYALGRGIQTSDRLLVRDLVASMTKDDYRIQNLIQGIVASTPFQQRRGLDPAPRLAAAHAQEARLRLT